MRKKITYIRDWEQMPVTLTPQEVAVLLNKNVQIIRKYAREKTLPAVKIGKGWVFTKDEVRKFIEGGAA